MNFTATCSVCGQRRLGVSVAADGTCMQCHADRAAEASRAVRDERQRASDENAARAQAALDAIVLTTETAHNLPVAERLDIVSAEVVIGMHLFKDIASAFRDTFGGRSKGMQDGLRDARKTALNELRSEALALGADAVVGIDLDYSEISGSGKSMLFLVASGTAVTLVPQNAGGGTG
ncbi:YbjQ family protein [Rhodobacter sp. NTK016B]|uniref:YbjQ family protein n=1 Tax=Rhodobacter sp. NTK016B TaxID=2759676 RepID=UPI0025709217|nr:YbjQ family protein [Rhodobacter sp. NTK016B]